MPGENWCIQLQERHDYLNPTIYRVATFPTFCRNSYFFARTSVLNYVNFLQKIDQNCQISYFLFTAKWLSLNLNTMIFTSPVCRFLRLHTLTALGYAVLVIDSRGSAHRGLQFEKHIKHRLVSTLFFFLIKFFFITGVGPH